MNTPARRRQSIDWGHLDFRLSGRNRLTAWWGDKKIATVTSERSDHLLSLIRKEVAEQHTRARLRGTPEASRTMDDMFAELAENLPEMLQVAAE